MHGLLKVFAALLLVLVLPTTAVLQLVPVSGAVLPSPGLSITITNPQRFTSDQSYDFSPTVIQGLDGTAWVFWEYIYFNGRSSLPVISYRTSSMPSSAYNASNWSGNQVLSQTPLSQNVAPSVSQFRNGTMYVSFASNRTGNYDIFLKKYSPGIGWSSDQQITLSPLDETGSSVVAASDHSLWLFWDRAINPTTANIYYRVSQGGSWSQETALTTDSSGIQNTQPSAYQMNDGSVWMVWTRTDSTTGIGNLYYRVYRSGTWSAAVQLTSGTNSDGHPAILQDSNTTIWVAWNRELPVGGSSFQFDIFYNYSVNGGASWAGETNLTNDTSCSSVCPEDMNPNLAQLKDGRIYLFWSSNRSPQNYWDLFYATTNVQPFHNMAVTALTASPWTLRDQGMVTINVTVANTGTFPESFWLFVRATNTSASTVAVQFLSLSAGQIMPLSIAWNTTGTKPAKYLLSATILTSQTENEIVTGDNTMLGPRLWLLPPGDVNMDGRDDIVDVALVAAAFDSTIGSPTWNPACDFNHDGKVNILDVATVAYWFGTYT